MTIFDVEPLTEHLAAIPPGVFTGELSGQARLILLLAFTCPDGTPTKSWLIAQSCMGQHAWTRACRELEQSGWLIRKNHGGMGRGKFRHERTFLRVPRPNPLLVK